MSCLSLAAFKIFFFDYDASRCESDFILLEVHWTSWVWKALFFNVNLGSLRLFFFFFFWELQCLFQVLSWGFFIYFFFFFATQAICGNSWAGDWTFATQQQAEPSVRTQEPQPARSSENSLGLLSSHTQSAAESSLEDSRRVYVWWCLLGVWGAAHFPSFFFPSVPRVLNITDLSSSLPIFLPAQRSWAPLMSCLFYVLYFRTPESFCFLFFW